MTDAPFRQPAEWEPHETIWLAWPSHEDLWGDEIRTVRDSFVQLCRAIACVDDATGKALGERLDVLVPDEVQHALAAQALAGLPVRFHRIAFGDIWLRDTAPIFVHDRSGAVVATRFLFNGWGEKYVLPHDDEVAGAIASASGLPQRQRTMVLEGGSVDVDGEGTVLTTRQCLRNRNRNGGLRRELIETELAESLGAERVLWLGDGLENDHTDGHVDTIARFVAPGVVVAMEPESEQDRNATVLRQILTDLRSMTDARGRALQVHTVPSPGNVLDGNGRLMPASYVNFLIANRAVIVPAYGVAADEEARRRLEPLFPTRCVVSVPARALLGGGGAFHCISQQQPAPRAPQSDQTAQASRGAS